MTYTQIRDMICDADILCLCVHALSFLTLKEKLEVRKSLCTLQDFLDMSILDIQVMIKRTTRTNKIDTKLISNAIFRSLNIALSPSYNIKYAIYGTPCYPLSLAQAFNPPYIIFYRGSLAPLEKKCIAMVGTRVPVKKARDAAISFATDAVNAGCCVVSGLASGIDYHSHKAAVDFAITRQFKQGNGEDTSKDGTTVGILASGPDCITPYSSVGLAKGILETGGAIMSEYFPGTQTMPYRFVARDRLIAALSCATVVAQSPRGSGALLTAKYAVQEEKELYFLDSCFFEETKKYEDEKFKRLSQKEKLNPKYKRTSQTFIENGARIISCFQEFATDMGWQ